MLEGYEIKSASYFSWEYLKVPNRRLTQSELCYWKISTARRMANKIRENRLAGYGNNSERQTEDPNSNNNNEKE